MLTNNGKDAALADESEWRKKQLVRAAQAIAIVTRLKEGPPELLDKVLEAAIVLNRVKWRSPERPRNMPISEWVEPSLESRINDCFHWPPGIDPETHQMLNQRAAALCLKKAIFELPAHFTVQNSGMSLNIPLAIRGKETVIQQLIFEITIDNREGNYQAELNRTISHMSELKTHFSRLRTCVMSVFFKEGCYHMKSPLMLQRLSRTNRTGYAQTESLQASLLKLINVFHMSGPGSRKFIRFSHEAGSLDQCDFCGPLVDITKTAVTIASEQNDGVISARAETDSKIGEQVLHQAYRYHRKTPKSRATMKRIAEHDEQNGIAPQ